MSAPGSSRGARGGGGRGRGGPSGARGGAQGAPLAAQMRQVLRLEEPKEMAVLRRFKDLGAVQVRSVYGQTGLLSQEICTMGPEGPEWCTLLEAEQREAERAASVARERALARRETRLPETRRRVSWGSLTPEEKRVLLFSQKEYDSFRASSRGTQAPQAGPAPAQQAGGGSSATPTSPRGAGGAAPAAPAGATSPAGSTKSAQKKS